MTLRVIVEADGGSRGNPGPAGYGALVRDADTGQVLREDAAGIGVASNNVAEYRGLIAGLTMAAAMGADQIEVRMDSKLVVEQMSGRWQVKHPDMKVLAREAAAICRELPAVKFTHMRREFNKAADALANAGMDAQAAGRQWQPGAIAEPRPKHATVTKAAPVGSAANRLVGWAAPAGPATSMLLVRHGETSLSIDRKFNGVNDSALTERGSAQAVAAANRISELKVDAVVTSPLPRCRKTAQAIATALGLEVAEEPGLVETNFGEWDGLSFAEVRDRWPSELDAWLSDPAVAPPGGESFVTVSKRVADARDRICSAHPSSSVIAVTHVTPIKSLLRDALEADVSVIYRIHIEPASLTRIDWHEDHHAVVKLVNDTAHLAGLTTSGYV